jgi:pantoate kinase
MKTVPPSSFRVVSGAFGPIPTASVLSNADLKRRINLCGRGLVLLQLRKLEISSFLQLSKRFAECLGILSPRLREALKRMESKRILSSMMMIGESFFTVVRRDLVPETQAIIRAVGLKPVVSKIARQGAKIL